MIKFLYRLFHSSWQTIQLDYPVVNKPRYGHGNKLHPELLQIIESQLPAYRELTSDLVPFFDDLATLKNFDPENNSIEAIWNNGYLPGLDILILYAMISTLKPKKYIEIGSGYSTKLAYLAKIRHNEEMQIISIDPKPRTEINTLSDVIIRETIENYDLSELEQLEKGDFLFIDNSHRMFPNSDSTVVFLEILPRLKKGVIVHFHDIYLPSDYPQFMCDRYYSEQYGLACFLLANPAKYKVLYPCYYLSDKAEFMSQYNGFWEKHNLSHVEKHGGSFWIEINQ